MAEGRFVSYLRVSTQKQGASGHGLEAQRAAVAAYLNGGGCSLSREFVEVESGRNNERPQLVAALALAKMTGATLVISKLDRLGRDASFLLNLQRAGVRFVACDNPHANELTIGLLAVIAQHEAEMISRRTREALTAAKSRGVKLGGLRWEGFGKLGNGAGVKTIKREADERAQAVLPIIEEIRAEGASTMAGIALELNARGILTARGGKWHTSTVSNVLRRVGA